MSPETVTGGSPLAIGWAAQDEVETGSGVSSVEFGYRLYGSQGETLAWPFVQGRFLPDPDGRSVATLLLNPWSAEGRYVLESIVLWDHIGNTTRYLRDGSVDAWPLVATPPPSAVDFALLDFDVVNPLGDSALPVISQLEPVTSSVVAGEPLILTSTMSDDLSGVANAAVRYEGPSGVTMIGARAEWPLADAGLLSGVVPRGAEGGRWRATSVYLEDRAGNAVHHYRDASTPIYRPDGVRPHQAQPVIDFASLDIDVVPREPDAEAPTLEGLRREGPDQLGRGDDAMFAFTAHDASPLAAIHLDFQDQTGHLFTVVNGCAPESGYAVRQVEAGLDDGPVRLMFVSVWDTLGNVRQYRRDGSVWTQGRLEPDALPGYDLSSMDFELVSDAPGYTAPHQPPLVCTNLAKLPVTVPDTASAGDEIPVAGQVLTSMDVPLPDAAVAVFATAEDGVAELVELTRSDDQGRYSVSHVFGDRDTTYQVRFLGREAATGADPTTGEPRTVQLVEEGDGPPALVSGVVRIAGTDRLATAVAASRSGWADGAAGAVVLTRADDYADALSGTPLAARHGGPLLLTATSRLDARVGDELGRVLSSGGTVYLLGGERAVSRAVEDDVRGRGYQVVRLGGSDRYATAVEVARQVTPTPGKVLLATGRSYADAVAAGAAAASGDGVVLLTDGTRMPAATLQYLHERPVQRVAVGGPAAAADPGATPVVGGNRYETAVLLAELFAGAGGALGVASGEGFADALAGGAHAARFGAVLVLTPHSGLAGGVSDHMETTGVRSVFVYGGSKAVSDNVMEQLRSVVE